MQNNFNSALLHEIDQVLFSTQHDFTQAEQEERLATIQLRNEVISYLSQNDRASSSEPDVFILLKSSYELIRQYPETNLENIAYLMAYLLEEFFWEDLVNG